MQWYLSICVYRPTVNYKWSYSPFSDVLCHKNIGNAYLWFFEATFIIQKFQRFIRIRGWHMIQFTIFNIFYCQMELILIDWWNEKVCERLTTPFLGRYDGFHRESCFEKSGRVVVFVAVAGVSEPSLPTAWPFPETVAQLPVLVFLLSLISIAGQMACSNVLSNQSRIFVSNRSLKLLCLE